MARGRPRKNTTPVPEPEVVQDNDELDEIDLSDLDTDIESEIDLDDEVEETTSTSQAEKATAKVETNTLEELKKVQTDLDLAMQDNVKLRKEILRLGKENAKNAQAAQDNAKAAEQLAEAHKLIESDSQKIEEPLKINADLQQKLFNCATVPEHSDTESNCDEATVSAEQPIAEDCYYKEVFDYNGNVLSREFETDDPNVRREIIAYMTAHYPERR